MPPITSEGARDERRIQRGAGHTGTGLGQLRSQTVSHTILFDPEMQIGAVEYTYEGTHRYHGVVLTKASGTLITHWRENQHISPMAWEESCV